MTDVSSDPRLVIAKVLAGAALALIAVYVIAGPQTTLPANVVGISNLVISVGAFTPGNSLVWTSSDGRSIK